MPQRIDENRPRLDLEPGETWEYSLLQYVRWDNTDEAKEDVIYFIRACFRDIAEEDPELLERE